MKIISIFVIAAVIILCLTIFVVSVRRALQHRAAVRRRLGVFGDTACRLSEADRAHLRDITFRDRHFDPVQINERLAPDGNPWAEVTSDAFDGLPLPRMMDFAECYYCGGPIPNHDEKCPHYVLLDIIGEPLTTPPPPNIGSDDLPYAGPNYVEAEEIADEMKGIVQYHIKGSGE